MLQLLPNIGNITWLSTHQKCGKFCNFKYEQSMFQLKAEILLFYVSWFVLFGYPVCVIAIGWKIFSTSNNMTRPTKYLTCHGDQIKGFKNESGTLFGRGRLSRKQVVPLHFFFKDTVPKYFFGVAISIEHWDCRNCLTKISFNIGICFSKQKETFLCFSWLVKTTSLLLFPLFLRLLLT